LEISGSIINSVSGTNKNDTRKISTLGSNATLEDTCRSDGKGLGSEVASYSASASELSFQSLLQGGAVLVQVYTKIP
jgi:hypothetical protein